MNVRVAPLAEQTVLAIHEDQLSRHGGMPGVCDQGLLESALAQPFASFGGRELYPSAVAKAARCGYGIIKNHPFADGNKRTGARWSSPSCAASAIASSHGQQTSTTRLSPSPTDRWTSTGSSPGLKRRCMARCSARRRHPFFGLQVGDLPRFGRKQRGESPT